MKWSHLPSSHLSQLFCDLKQVLHNVRTQLKLFMNLGNIFGVSCLLFVWSYKRIRNHTTSKLNGMSISLKFNQFIVVLHQNQVHDKKYTMKKLSTGWPFCLLQVNCVPSNYLSCTWRCGIPFPKYKNDQMQHPQRCFQNYELAKTTQSEIQHRFYVCANWLYWTIIIGKNFHHRTNSIPFPAFTHNIHCQNL